MGNVADGPQPVAEHGLFKTHRGPHIIITPLADQNGNLNYVPECTIIFLHEERSCPQAYLGKFYNKQTSRWTPMNFALRTKYILLQAPIFEKEGKYLWGNEALPLIY